MKEMILAEPKTLPLKIYGVNPCSDAADNIFAPSVFLFGCNLRCPYCMNSRLVVSKPDVDDVASLSHEDVKSAIEESNSDWIMISGGEPLMSNTDKLIALLQEFKSWDKKIGLSTNGTYPDELEKVIPFLNYVTMDLKSDQESDYKEIYYRPNEMVDLTFKVFYRSMDILRNNSTRDDFDYEYRTTLYPSMVDAITIIEIAKHIQVGEKWVLQQFRHAKNMLNQEKAEAVAPYPIKQVEGILSLARRYVDNVTLRYV